MKIAVLLLMIAGAIPAEAKDLSDVQHCMAGKTTNIEWAKCTANELKLQEVLLQKTWKKLEATYWNRDEGYRALVDEQKQWEAFKEQACGVYAIDFGREGQVLNAPTCKAKIIEQRTEYLQELLTAVTPDSPGDGVAR